MDINNSLLQFKKEINGKFSSRTENEYYRVAKQLFEAFANNSTLNIRSQSKYHQVKAVLKKLKHQNLIPADAHIKGIPDSWSRHGESSKKMRAVFNKAYSEDDFHYLLDKIAALNISDNFRHELILIAKISFYSGMRLSEALSLGGDSIRIADDGSLTLVIKYAKGSKFRIAYLPKCMLPDIKDFTGFYYISQKYVVNKFSEMQKGEHPIKSSFHGLRHGFAARCRKIFKMPIEELQKIMGHSRVETTINYYLHQDDKKPESMSLNGY